MRWVRGGGVVVWALLCSRPLSQMALGWPRDPLLRLNDLRSADSYSCMAPSHDLHRTRRTWYDESQPTVSGVFGYWTRSGSGQCSGTASTPSPHDWDSDACGTGWEHAFASSHCWHMLGSRCLWAGWWRDLRQVHHCWSDGLDLTSSSAT